MRAYMVFWVGVSLLRLSGPSCPGDEHGAILGAPLGERAPVCVFAEAVPATGLTITHATSDGKVSTLTRVALTGNADAAVALSIGSDGLEPAGAVGGAAHVLDGAQGSAGRCRESSTLLVLVVVSDRRTTEHGTAWECRPRWLPWGSDRSACGPDLPGGGGVRRDDGIDDDCACGGKRDRNGTYERDALWHLVVEHDGARRESGIAGASRHVPLSSMACPWAR